MDIIKFFTEEKDVVLTPSDFKEIILSAFPDLSNKYNVGEICFAECFEKEIQSYPVVVWSLTAKNEQYMDYAYFIPQTEEVKIWTGNLNFRKLNHRDVAHKIEMHLNGGKFLGKIAMRKGQIVFRFRAK